MKKTLIWVLVIVVLAAIIYFAYPAFNKSNKDILSGTYLLNTVNGVELAPDLSASLTFSQTEETIEDATKVVSSLSAKVCNNFNSSYNINDDILIVGALAGNKKSCQEPVGLDDLESELQVLLSSQPSIKADQNTITLSSGDKTFVFKK